MTALYTVMPLEAVLDGFHREQGPFVELTLGDTTLQVRPVAPGVGRIVRLVSAPLHRYLQPEWAPGQTLVYGGAPVVPVPERPADEALPADAGSGV